MGKENSDAQNNENCSYSLEHRRILSNRSTKRSTLCTVKEIPLGGMKLPSHDEFEQQLRPSNPMISSGRGAATSSVFTPPLREPAR
jgi:hypothetical protein